MLTSEDTSTIEALLQQLLGREAWGAEVGIGSFLLLEFGDPVEQLQNAVGVLNGLRIEAITIAPVSGDTIFQFQRVTGGSSQTHDC